MTDTRVTLVAYTMFMQDVVAKVSGYIPQDEYIGLVELEDSLDFFKEIPEETHDRLEELYAKLPKSIDELAEFAGRNCYQAWNRPNPKTASNEGYLQNILNQEHYSVLEHGSATFVLNKVSTGFLGRLTRHRHLSFSVLSNRFVNRVGAELAPAPGLYPDGTKGEEAGLAEAVLVHALEAYEEIVERLTDRGYTRKQAREAARAVLPQGIETSIVVTGNMRAWRDVLKKRNTPYADAEDQEIAKLILLELKKIAPNSFQDMG